MALIRTSSIKTDLQFKEMAELKSKLYRTVVCVTCPDEWRRGRTRSLQLHAYIRAQTDKQTNTQNILIIYRRHIASV